MPTTRDPDRTRRLILDAAAAEFCDVGPAGARIDSIAAAAGVNKRMLYHYFGSKDGLFAAVLADRLEATPVGPTQADLSERMTALQHHALAHPEDIRLLMWEALAYRDGEVAAGSGRIAAWRRDVEAIAGRANAGVDAAQLWLACAGMVLFPFAFPQLTRLICGIAADDADFLDAQSRLLATVAKLFETPAPVETAPQPKPRFRLTANVTETAPGQRRQTDSKTLK